MNISNIVAGICSLLFFMIGADKFLMFLEPPCSIMDQISPMVWKGLGVLQVLAGILIWLPKFRRPVAGFFFCFMMFFTFYHIASGTYDIGGAVFMAVLLALLFWNPSFIRAKQKSV